MAEQYPNSGPHNASAYVLPGIPWVTGSTLTNAVITHYSFPCATNSFTVRNTTAGTTLAVGFTANGLSSTARKFFTLTGVQDLKLDFRIKDMYLSATIGLPVVEVIAGLSHVPYSSFPVMTGSVSGTSGTETYPLFSGVG